jgi:hypothetical protein
MGIALGAGRLEAIAMAIAFANLLLQLVAR